MENMLAAILSSGQNRAPNTIALRKAYDDYVIQAQSNGEEPLKFEEWAKSNYPDMKILEQ